MIVLASLCFGVAGILVGLHALATYLAGKGEKDITIGEGDKKHSIGTDTLRKHSAIWGAVAVILGILFIVIGGHDGDSQA
jgi:hypothetical protein